MLLTKPLYIPGCDAAAAAGHYRDPPQRLDARAGTNLLPTLLLTLRPTLRLT
jgi:hypothetical protein